MSHRTTFKHGHAWIVHHVFNWRSRTVVIEFFFYKTSDADVELTIAYDRNERFSGKNNRRFRINEIHQLSTVISKVRFKNNYLTLKNQRRNVHFVIKQVPADSFIFIAVRRNNKGSNKNTKTPVRQWSYVFFSIMANTKYPCALFTYTCTPSLFVFRVRNVYLRILRITFSRAMWTTIDSYANPDLAESTDRKRLTHIFLFFFIAFL